MASYVSEVRGIDISVNMVHEYNTRAQNQGLYPSEMSAVVGDLLDPSGASPSICEPDLFQFDLAVVGFSLHHFANPELAVMRLLERLKAGTGVLLIIDFLPHEHIASIGHHTVAHHGFGESDMTAILERAACQEVDYVVLGRGVTRAASGEQHERGVFMCKGRKASHDP